jgi:hypothetical protein
MALPYISLLTNAKVMCDYLAQNYPRHTHTHTHTHTLTHTHLRDVHILGRKKTFLKTDHYFCTCFPSTFYLVDNYKSIIIILHETLKRHHQDKMKTIIHSFKKPWKFVQSNESIVIQLSWGGRKEGMTQQKILLRLFY